MSTTTTDQELLSAEELEQLSDDELVKLLMERGSIRDEARAREALDILRGGPPVGVTY